MNLPPSSKMKRYLLVFLSSLMLCQGSAALWISAAFFANQNYIAKTSCRLKEQENNSCQGKCVLMQKLQEQEEKKQQQSKFEFKSILLFLNGKSAVPELSNQISLLNRALKIPSSEDYPWKGFSSRIFRPPISIPDPIRILY